VDHAAEVAEVISALAQPRTSKFPEFPDSPDVLEASETPSSRTDWPEPEAASSGTAASAQDGPKRKRRRKKGKGGSSQNSAPPAEGEPLAQAADEPSASAPQPQTQAPRPNQVPRSKLDAELLAKCAWKIYLAEISEEGVALVGDNDAKELSRRCFRLAEIFMEEQARRR